MLMASGMANLSCDVKRMDLPLIDQFDVCTTLEPFTRHGTGTVVQWLFSQRMFVT